MEFFDILKNEYMSAVFGGAGGIITAWITQRVINKRGIFSYFVNHNRVGMSTQDSVFGNVAVTWNNTPANHLFLSAIELKNESLNDYENVVINTYTSNTRLLTESTQIIDTPNVLQPTGSYIEKIKVEPGEEPNETQRAIYHGQREYLIPVFNRGQKVRIIYLNSATSDDVPSIWLSATIKGVKVKFQAPQIQIYGVPRNIAALTGAVIGLLGVVPLVIYVSNPWAVALLALAYGYFVIFPGAFTFKLFRKAREAIGG